MSRPNRTSDLHQQPLYPISQHCRHRRHRPTFPLSLYRCRKSTRPSSLVTTALDPRSTSRVLNSSTNLQLRYPRRCGKIISLLQAIRHIQHRPPTSTTSVSAPRLSTPSLPPAREAPSSAKFRCTSGQNPGTTRLPKRQIRKLWLAGGQLMWMGLLVMTKTTRRRKSDAGSVCLGGG